ncbi:MAG: protein-disulfide reductase DsbD domain-containing protein [Planctomycetota bacterium]
MTRELPQLRNVWLWILAIGFLVAGAAPASAQFEEDPVAVTVRWNPEQVGGGDEVTLEIQIKCEPGWHIYGTRKVSEVMYPSVLKIEPNDMLTPIGEPVWPTPIDHPGDEWSRYTYHEGVITVKQRYTVFYGANTPISIRGSLDYMSCTMERCLPQAQKKFTATLVPGNKIPVDLEKAADVSFDSKVPFTGRGAVGVEPGATFELQFNFDIEPGWHIYGTHQDPESGKPTLIQLAAGSPFEAAGRVKEPRPKIVKKSGYTYREHHGKIEMKLPLRAPKDIVTGRHDVKVEVTTQACDPSMCLPEETVELTLPVWVSGGKPAPGLREAPPPSNGSGGGKTPVKRFVTFAGEFSQGTARAGDVVSVKLEGKVDDGYQIPVIQDPAKAAAEQGFLGIIWLAIGAALVALLTPCVYPMIPITVSMFAKRAEDEHTNVPALAVIFCLGIIVTFTGIGVTVALAMGEDGANFLATHWLVNLCIGLLFLWFAGSLFGYYTIQLPSWLTQRATSAGSGGGIASVLLMGLVFSITTFTCVGPIVSTLFLLAAQGGLWLAVTGMVAFSSTFALPFFFLALFPKALSGLPRSGGWLNSVKVLLAFVEVAAAFKFFCVVPLYFGPNLIYREAVLFIWGLIFVTTIFYLIGKVKFPGDPPVQKITLGRWVVIGAMAWISGYCFYGASGFYLNPSLEAQLSEPHPHFAKILKERVDLDYVILAQPDHPLDFEDTMAKLEGSGKPIFINFTGHT